MSESIPTQEVKTFNIDIVPGYEDFLPEEFKESPLSYFETRGVNIKQGEKEYDESGRVKEDPTAVKDMPTWTNKEGQELYTVGKRVNLEKGKVGETEDPFYEYQVMEYVRSMDLPSPKPIAKVTEGGTHLIIMERVPGLRWSYRSSLKKQGFTDDDVNRLHTKAESMMATLQRQFEERGIIRGWKLSDMVFDIDIENKDIRSLIPVDWERTQITP